MSKKYKILDQDSAYFITSTVVDWINLFTKNRYRDILIRALLFSIENKGLVIHSWVIMSNHIHLLVSRKGNVPLYRIVQHFKSWTSRRLIEEIKINGDSRERWLLNQFAFASRRCRGIEGYKVWQDGFHPLMLQSDKPKGIVNRLNYIHDNPVKAGWVDKAEDYVYSSARDYMGQKGMLPLEMYDPLLLSDYLG